MKRLKLLNSLAFRNLIRQRRRNLLLGVAIAFGTMILILANSFSRGITDTLLNKIVVQMTGHLELAVLERSRAQNLLIRDRTLYLDLLQKNLPDVREIAENVAVFSRAIGNGKGENVIVVPMDFGDGQNLAQNSDAEYLMSRVQEGKIEDMLSAQYENPVAVFADKSRALNIKLFDTIKVRLKTVSGQEQSARFTVVMQLKSESLFESGAIFLPIKNLKELRAIRANETGSLQVTFKNFDSPRTVIRLADKIHSLLKPGIAAIHGEVKAGKKAVPVTAGGLTQDFEKSDTFKKSIQLVKGAWPRDRDTDRILISETVAAALKLKPDAKLVLRFKSIHATEDVEQNLIVSGIFKGAGDAPSKVEAYLPEAAFYKAYLSDLPVQRTLAPENISDEWKKILAPEFRLLPRTSNVDDFQKKNQELRKTGFFGPAIDVRTMYETASEVIKFETTLGYITWGATGILFFIILIGVVNTLRMTIRERTREIGTMRAIGVRRGDVRSLFLFETMQLTFFSSVVGLILAFVAMFALSSFAIETQSVMGILLVKKKLYFLPLVLDVMFRIALIVMISLVTAFFPSHRAAKRDAAEALRHYE
jgi:putative ABC transport system permease protein